MRETIRGTIFYIICFLNRKLFTLNLKEGAQTQLYMCYLPHKEFVGGAYYDKCAIGKMNEKCKDEKLKQAVLDWTLKTMKEISEKRKLNLDI